MNFWAFAFLLSNFIWAIFFERPLLYIYLIFLMVYLVPSYLLGFATKNSFRRRAQIASWTDSGDPCSYTRLEVEMEPVERFLEEFNAKNPQNKLTLTLLFVKALAMGLSESKKSFGKLAVGHFVPVDSMDLSFLVDVNGENLANAVLRDVARKPLGSLNEELRSSVKEFKGGKNKELNKQVSIMRFTPSFVVQLLIRVASFFSYDLGVSFKLGDVKPNNFGHGIVTNIVSFDIPDSFAPLVPFLKGMFVAVMNTPFTRPLVKEGKVTVGKVMNLNLTYDQRFADVYQVGIVAKKTLEMLARPTLML